MNFVPANAEPFFALGLPQVIPDAPALFGVCYDGTTSFRPGARFGPDAIRSVAQLALESYSPAQGRDLEDHAFADLGNLDTPFGAPEPVVEMVHAATGEVLRQGGIPFVLGGEHSISPGAIRAVFEARPDLRVIQFDAHADLRESFDGNRHSHASAMRRVLDFLPPGRLIQVGIRSGLREEFAEMDAAGRRVDAEPAALAEALSRNGFADGPIYVTFDLDLFDPSVLPGTGTPEPGGIDWRTFETLLAALPAEQIAGLDVVELSPKLDPGEVSSVTAAKVVREFLLALAR